MKIKSLFTLLLIFCAWPGPAFVIAQNVLAGTVIVADPGANPVESYAAHQLANYLREQKKGSTMTRKGGTNDTKKVNQSHI